MTRLYEWLKNMNTAAQALLGLLAFATIIVAGVGIFTFKAVAKSEASMISAVGEVSGDLQVVEHRLDNKILKDDRRAFRLEIRQIERIHQSQDGRWLANTPQKLIDAYELLKDELKDIEEQLENINRRNRGDDPGG